MSELTELLIRKLALKDVELAVASGITSLDEWLNQQYLEIEQEITKLKENKDD